MPPLLVLGVDGLPPRLLRALIAQGRLPTLSELARRGSLSVLRSTPNYQSASAWTSMATGVNPGQHGILHFMNPVTGSYDLAPIDARARRCPTIWRLLSDEGVRVAALNVPVSYPAEPVYGVMVAGWLCPSPSSPGFTHPPELAGLIARRFGDYPIHADVRRHAARGDFEGAIAAAVRGIQAKGRVARWLLQREEPDLLGVVLTEIDSLQHWCWHLLDAFHPEHDAALAGRWRERLLSAYECVDRQLAGLLEVTGADADVLVLSDHGQATNSGAQVLLRSWLRAAGYLVAQRSSVPGQILDRTAALSLDLLRRGAPARVKAVLRARLPALQRRAQAGLRAVRADWQHTRAWTETGHIFLNVRGRQPQGIVEPGEDCVALLAELEEELSSLVDAQTGVPVVAGTTRGAAVFDGPYAAVMPDLLVHWRHGGGVRAVRWRGQVIECTVRPTLPSGAHHPDGILLVAGPHFRALAAPAPRSIYDVAPTLLHLLGQPVPSYFDGRVMVELLTDEAAKEARVTTVNLRPRAGDGGPARAAQEVIAQRLRSLGYID
ncbi:MAG: alkaline phosphatase family protein [Armatimonadota bacterium]